MINGSEYAPVECVNIPKMLFQEKQFEKLSADAKLLYSLLLDRKNVARMNGWVDQYGTAYVIYPKSEMKKNLNASRYRVDMALDELEKCGQMVVVTQPNPGRPCQIYVKDITGNMMRDMEEKPMCMMMKEPNDKNDNQMMRPCMGIPGMHGVAVFFDPEDFLKAMESFEGEDEDPDLDEDAEENSDTESADEASEDGCKHLSSYYDYKDEAYYSLSRRDQKMIDMAYRGYIDEDDEVDEDAIYGDAMDFGDELGITIGHVFAGHGDDMMALFDYMTELYDKKKYSQLKAALTMLSLVFDGSPEYLEDLHCCLGEAKKYFVKFALGCMKEIAVKMEKRDGQMKQE